MYDEMNPVTGRAKRAFDFALASLALLMAAPLFPLIALLIKLDSPGPVLFRQLRIGRARSDRTLLFEMIKFRTMRVDAEQQTGAVWATRQDSRVTRVGRFLRKTRLDELPQLVNVLKGDMSLIGPRPERPGFYRRLEHEIPYFAERTYGVTPGITGLAQVSGRSDLTFREEVKLDLQYIEEWSLWFDLWILWRTAMVVLFRNIVD